MIECSHRARDRKTLRLDPIKGFPLSQVYILELFSGHGDVSALARGFFNNCPVETVDCDTTWGMPTVQARLPGGIGKVLHQMRARHPGKRPIIWASPCCANFSRAKTRGERNLVVADTLVESSLEIADELDAVCMVIENPATGLLKDRDVIACMPHRFEVHYCRYGALFQKPTMLWCTHDLTAHGFAPKVCNWECDSWMDTGSSKRHVSGVQNENIAVKMSVPRPLVCAVFRAVANLLRAMDIPGEPARTRAKTSRELSYVSDALQVEDRVLVLAHWKGSDASEWIDIDALHEDPRELPFFDDDIKQRCIGMFAWAD